MCVVGPNVGIDLVQIWDIINDDLPTLKHAILEIIEPI